MEPGVGSALERCVTCFLAAFVALVAEGMFLTCPRSSEEAIPFGLRGTLGNRFAFPDKFCRSRRRSLIEAH
jgi:hypothetical protein